MRVRTLLVVLSAAAALTACGGDTSEKSNNDNNVPADMGVDDSGSGEDTGGMDTGGGEDTGGTDTGGADTGGADTGGDAGADIGPDTSNSVCGNGVAEPGEDCDDGNANDDDECKSDCTFTCGDGVVGTNEECDTAIADGMPGACPTACDDGMACTTDALEGNACQTRCVTGDITACQDGDGCCPSTCDETLDDDCDPMCGNDVVETGEECDGNCPADCDDGMACTADSMMGAPGTCDAVCVNTDITMCTDGDGCCPTTCDATNDSDCSASCGNDVVEPPETCDGNCPVAGDCDDNDMCTTDTLDGNAGQCTAQCVNTAITMCVDGDGCCPSACDATTDSDCVATCGNGSIEGAEECDDGNTMGGDGCDANCQVEPVAFRMSDLDVRDPHIFADLPIFGCNDITDNAPFVDSVNEMLEIAIQQDDDGDGLLDISFLLIFDPLDQADGAMNTLEVAEADCTEPMSSTMCTVDTTVHTVETSTYTSDTTTDCLDALPGTTSNYTPNVAASIPPCFSSASVNLTVDVGGILIPLTEVQVGGTYVGNPATDLSSGLLRGFVSETTANSIVIPDTIAVVGGQPLSMLLPGGDPPDTGDACNGDGDCTAAGETCEGGSCETVPNCAPNDDRDMNGGESGWWFYFNFPATQVPYTML